MDAPASGLPSSKTTPATGVVRWVPQPASVRATIKHGVRIIRASTSDVETEQLGRTYRHAVIATAKVLIGAVVDILVDETQRAIDEGEVGPTGMIRLKTPSNGPIHDAAGLITRWIGGPITKARAERGRRIGHAIDLPIDRLNRLALRDVIAAGPPRSRVVAHEFAVLGQGFTDEERIGGSVCHIGQANEGGAAGIASGKHPTRIRRDGR